MRSETRVTNAFAVPLFRERRGDEKRGIYVQRNLRHAKSRITADFEETKGAFRAKSYYKIGSASGYLDTRTTYTAKH